VSITVTGKKNTRPASRASGRRLLRALNETRQALLLVASTPMEIENLRGLAKFFRKELKARHVRLVRMPSSRMRSELLDAVDRITAELLKLEELCQFTKQGSSPTRFH
jgi:hypothetical protein